MEKIFFARRPRLTAALLHAKLEPQTQPLYDSREITQRKSLQLERLHPVAVIFSGFVPPDRKEERLAFAKQSANEQSSQEEKWWDYILQAVARRRIHKGQL